MQSNLITLVLAAALVATAAPVFARDVVPQATREAIQLKDGSILYVFKDGKMSKEDKFGRAVLIKSGEVLEAADGRKVTAVGNESARLDGLLNDGHRQ